MLKHLLLLVIAISLYDTMGADTMSGYDKCFRENCCSAFLLDLGQYPICGTDGKPYHNVPAFDCAKNCARRFDLKLEMAYYGRCNNKPPALEYWKLQ
ncbi:hypothetical protein WA026_023032 [Henosepilachna vigintioctopunctata]|uniref:Kazal-like domain-containing protein n=1 Tax=Henosepilachna vigintioctopunctata TaxID=420089 RepID=A0AAW1VDQ2_9CUCU